MYLRHPVRVVDRFCGSGKTTELIQSLSPRKQYLIIAPYLSEVSRIIQKAKERGVTIVEPLCGKKDKNKQSNLLQLARARQNICTTHAMYPRLFEAAKAGLFADYSIIIDEVVETVKPLDRSPSKDAWQNVYVGDGYVEIDTYTGQVTPSAKWDAVHHKISDVLSREIYTHASTGTLYVHADTTLVWALPRQLLTAGRELTVYTYQSEGSMMTAYLDRVGIPYEIDWDDVLDREYLSTARGLLTVKLLTGLTDLKFSYSGQKSMHPNAIKRVATTLNNLGRRGLQGVPRDQVILTCVKDAWFASGNSWKDLEGTGRTPKATKFSKGTGLLGVNWLPNTTRGANDWSHCSHVVYLYDQHPSPSVKAWLNMDYGWQDRYALSEGIQLIWRSRIRKREPVTVYFASRRMYDLFNAWLASSDKLRAA